MFCRLVALDRGLLAGVAMVLSFFGQVSLGQLPPPPRSVEASADRVAFEQLDGNEDGVLSGKEALSVLAYDTNGDKRVTEAEFLAARPAARAVDPVIEDNKKFVELDSNEDGWLSGKEMKGLERFDVNKDTEISKAEFLVGRALDRSETTAVSRLPAARASFNSFLVSVARHDAKQMLAQMHSELAAKVDEPVLQFFLDAIHTELGDLSDDKPTDMKQDTQDVNGTPMTTTTATLAFARGEAHCELSIQDSKIVAYSIESDKLTDLNQKLGNRMAEDEAFAKRVGEFYGPLCQPVIALILQGKDEQVHAMLHPEIQEQLPLDLIKAECQKARTLNGALKSIEYDGFTVVLDPDSGAFKRISVNYQLTCEQGPADAKVELEFAGFLGVVLGFSVTKHDDETPAPPVPAPTELYRNQLDKLPARHAEKFVPFSFNYPKSWKLDAKAGTAESSNVVEVSRNISLGDGLEFTQENFAVGSCQVIGSGEVAKLGLALLSEQFRAAFAKGFPEFKLNHEGDMKFGKYDGFGFDFTSKLPHPKKGQVDCWGRVILLAQSAIGQEHGLALVVLATSEAPELKGLADLGVNGQLLGIINSFNIGVEEEVTEPAPLETPDTKTAASKLYDRGVELAEKDNLDGAIVAFTQAIELEPRNADCYVARGTVRYQKNDVTGAVDDYSKAIVIDPANFIAYNNRGFMRYFQDDLNSAMQDYDQALKLNPEYALPYSNRGLVKLLRFQDAEAQHDFDKSQELLPGAEFAALLADDIREAKLRRAKAATSPPVAPPMP